jgi:hypothetical protein
MLYVSSILAWIHQTIAAEKEYIEAIFYDHSSSSTSSSVTSSGSNKLNEYNPNDFLSRIISSLGKPLRVRILQTLENNTSIDILYGLADLLVFYERIIFKLVPIEGNAIHSCLKGCFQECKRIFLFSLKRQIDYLNNTANSSIITPIGTNLLLSSSSASSGIHQPSSMISSSIDLKVSTITREYSKLITNILKIGCNALSNLPFEKNSDVIPSSSSPPPSESGSSGGLSTTPMNQFHLDVVLGDIIQPLLQYCRIQVSKLPSNEMAIYMLNNTGFLQVC